MFLVSITLSWIFGQNPGQSEIQDNVKYSITNVDEIVIQMVKININKTRITVKVVL